jgi:hypothetical protein
LSAFELPGIKQIVDRGAGNPELDHRFSDGPTNAFGKRYLGNNSRHKTILLASDGSAQYTRIRSCHGTREDKSGLDLLFLPVLERSLKSFVVRTCLASGPSLTDSLIAITDTSRKFFVRPKALSNFQYSRP